MRYQVIVPSDEFSEAMTINAVSWAPFEGLGDNVNFNAFTIDMGLCAADILNPMFDTNYISGTKIRVFERAAGFSVSAAYPWTTITLDTPFFYDPSAGSLILEIQWPSGNEQIYTFDFPTEGASIIKGGFGAASGDPFPQAPHLLIEGELSLSQMTFAGIKATFR